MGLQCLRRPLGSSPRKSRAPAAFNPRGVGPGAPALRVESMIPEHERVALQDHAEDLAAWKISERMVSEVVSSFSPVGQRRLDAWRKSNPPPLPMHCVCEVKEALGCNPAGALADALDRSIAEERGASPAELEAIDDRPAAEGLAKCRPWIQSLAVLAPHIETDQRLQFDESHRATIHRENVIAWCEDVLRPLAGPEAGHDPLDPALTVADRALYLIQQAGGDHITADEIGKKIDKSGHSVRAALSNFTAKLKGRRDSMPYQAGQNGYRWL